MRVSTRAKRRLEHLPRQWYSYTPTGEEIKRPRKTAIYYPDWCCQNCYFDWGRWFEKRTMYKHNSAYANYKGLLKKYWKNYDYAKEDEG